MTDLTEQFVRLERNPLWEKDWTPLVESLKAFHAQWAAAATAAGWSIIELYGLDAAAPYARLDHWGGAFLASLPDRKVVSVDAQAIQLITERGVKLSAYKPAAGGVLAWQIEIKKR